MKSSINILVDYREAPFEKNVTLRCPEEHIQAQLKHLTRGYKKTEAVQTVEKGDVVMLSLESELPKFNRPTVPVTVGGKLFDAELEEQLSGHAVGESFTATVQGKPVNVTLKQASRTVFPEPTDGMAAEYANSHDEFEGITTVEEYRTRIIDNYLEDGRREALFGTMDEILGYVLSHSDWEFDDEEIAALVLEEKNFINMQLKEDQDRELDSLTDEEIKLFLGAPSREELESMIVSGAEQRIATALWLASISGADAKAGTLEQLEEEADWSFLENFVKENMTVREER